MSEPVLNYLLFITPKLYGISYSSWPLYIYMHVGCAAPAGGWLGSDSEQHCSLNFLSVTLIDTKPHRPRSELLLLLHSVTAHRSIKRIP